MIHAHRLIAETAHAMAHELYDTMMMDNLWYKVWKDSHPGLSAKGLENAFVKKNIERCVEEARATLASMLAGPLDERLKDEILDALVLDKTLVKGRAEGHRVIGSVR